MPRPTSQNCSPVVMSPVWQRLCNASLVLRVLCRPRAGALAAVAVFLLLCSGSQARSFGHFRSVLAQGEGQTITAGDLSAYEATHQPPASFVNQQPLYVGIMPRAH